MGGHAKHDARVAKRESAAREKQNKFEAAKSSWKFFGRDWYRSFEKEKSDLAAAKARSAASGGQGSRGLDLIAKKYSAQREDLLSGVGFATIKKYYEKYAAGSTTADNIEPQESVAHRRLRNRVYRGANRNPPGRTTSPNVQNAASPDEVIKWAESIFGRPSLGASDQLSATQKERNKRAKVAASVLMPEDSPWI